MSEDHNRHDCSYESAGQRCRYPGAISLGTTGGGPWYCRVHARERGSRFAQQALEQSQSYRAPVVEENLTWLAEKFPMQAGESRGGYNARSRAYALSMLGTFRAKPVAGPPRAVNTEPVRIRQADAVREVGEDAIEVEF